MLLQELTEIKARLSTWEIHKFITIKIQFIVFITFKVYVKMYKFKRFTFAKSCLPDFLLKMTYNSINVKYVCSLQECIEFLKCTGQVCIDASAKPLELKLRGVKFMLPTTIFWFFRDSYIKSKS